MLEESYFVEILNITSPYYYVDATVYVGGLDDKVSEAILWELFLQAGPVGELSVRSRSSAWMERLRATLLAIRHLILFCDHSSHTSDLLVYGDGG